jgi:predicted aspartyl protease
MHRPACPFLSGLVAALLLAGVASVMAASGDEPHLHLLYLDSNGFRLEPLQLKSGESRSFVIDRESELVDVIYTVGTGTSGNVIQRSTNSYTVTIRRDGDTYHSTSTTGAGRTRTLPPLSIADLGADRMRLDITAADGREKAFVIEAGLHVQSNVSGPVMDMFQGLVPLAPGDISIATRTERIDTGAARPAAVGEAELVYDKGLLFTRASPGSGAPLEFIVDFAAGATVIAKSALPGGVVIQVVEGVEYSEDGPRKIQSTMKGAGGDVSGFLGTAILQELTVGTLVFRNVKVSVLSSLPELGGHNPAGILGMNLLSRANLACLTYPTPGKVGHLRLAEESHVKSDESISFPFTRVGNHLFVAGAVDDAPVTFIFDTGARRAHLHSEVAKAAGIAVRPDDDPAGTRGLDGQKMETHLVEAEELRLGEAAFARVPFVVADMPVFQSIGLGTSAGLLGNTFLDRFAEVEIDFEQEIIRLVPGSGAD